MSEDRIKKIETLLHKSLAPRVLRVIDDSAKHRGHAGAASGAGHFSIYITSQAFSGKTPIQCHQMVYKALASMMDSEIHALKIKTTVA